jgi:Mg-chelatase subunit ChlI
MARRKSPWQKKQDAYDRDYRLYLENPHAFRKNWPKKKARANRAERVKARSLLAGLPPEDVTAGAIEAAVARVDIVKSGVVTLRTRIRDNLHRRGTKLGPQP